MTDVVRALNALLIFVISWVLLGALYIQFFMGEEPCPLCYMQRLGLVGISVGALLNLTCGLRPAHYGFSLAAAIYGGAVALRQIALHVCPQFSTFGTPVWGLSLYSWSFITHACAVLAIAWFLFMQEEAGWGPRTRSLNWWEWLSAVLLVLVVVLNFFATAFQCGAGSCSG